MSDLDDMVNSYKEAADVASGQAKPRKKYVLGFAFTSDRRWVVLINKTRPEFQAGKLNGVGGKVEPNEHPIKAMAREFQEETNVAHDDWRHYATMEFKDAVVYVFETTLMLPNDWCQGSLNTSVVLALNTPWKTHEKGPQLLPLVKRVGWPTDEVPCVANVQNLPDNVMTNLRWLIPMATDPGFERHLTIDYDEGNS